MSRSNDRVPRVSIVMAVHNGEPYIREAIHSMLNQTLADIEFIIVDDGSTDQTHSILVQFAGADRRVQVHNQEHSGIVVSLNRAVKLAKGELIARMDADDISMPQRLERQVAYLDSHNDVGVVGTWMQDIDATGTLGSVWPLPTSPATIRWFLMFGNCMAHPSVMMRRELAGSLAYRTDAEYVEDYDLWIRASKITGLANIPEVLLRHRVLDKSVSGENLTSQEKRAEQLQRGMRAEIADADENDVFKLYQAYRRTHPLSRGDESEIVLDVLRRLSLSGKLNKAALPLLPRLFSFQTLGKVLRYGFSYASHFPHGFTTQRRKVSKSV